MLEKDLVIKYVENSLRYLPLRMNQPIKRKLLVNGWILP